MVHHLAWWWHFYRHISVYLHRVKEIWTDSGITPSITYMIYVGNIPVPHSPPIYSPFLTALASAHIPFSPSSALPPTSITLSPPQMCLIILSSLPSSFLIFPSHLIGPRRINSLFFHTRAFPIRALLHTSHWSHSISSEQLQFNFSLLMKDVWGVGRAPIHSSLPLNQMSKLLLQQCDC